jgi:putative membrane protein
MEYKRILKLLILIVIITNINTIDVYSYSKNIVNETTYVNLNHYGEILKKSVVKGVTLLSDKERNYIDYGKYKSIRNMTGDFKPIIKEGKVEWKVPKEYDKFYFECFTEDIKIPWNIEISYKLNGLPVEAEDLAGAKGLIEIHMEGLPNKDVSEYIKNNMMMEIIYIPDSKHTKSVSVDGSMVQSIGDMHAAAYVVFPNSDFEVDFEVVSDFYEDMGFQIIIQPVTSDRLEVIQEMKEIKDDMEDSMDLMYESLDNTLSSIDKMQSSAKGMKEAIKSINKARTTISDSGDDIDNQISDSVRITNQLSAETLKLLSYIDKTKKLVSNLSGQLRSLDKNIEILKVNIGRLSKRIEYVNDDIDDIEDFIDDAKDNNIDIENTLIAFDENIEDAEDLLNTLEPDVKDLRNSIDSLEDDIGDLKTGMNQLASSPPPGISPDMIALANAIGPSLGSTEDLLVSLEEIVRDSEKAISNSKKGITTMKKVSKDLKDTVKLANDGIDIVSDQVSNLEDINKSLIETLETSESIIIDFSNILKLLEAEETNINSALDDINKLLNSTVEALNSAEKSLTLLDKIYDDSREDLD